MSDTDKFDVEVLWKGDAAEAHGRTTRYGGIEWVCEQPDEVILVPEDGTPDQPPRIVVDRDDICGWHELSPDLAKGDEGDENDDG